jgi:hypothetical protein
MGEERTNQTERKTKNEPMILPKQNGERISTMLGEGGLTEAGIERLWNRR